MPTKGSGRASDNVTIVLHRPSIPENIGSVVRVMKNTGFSRLILSDPRTEDLDTAGRLAVSARSLLDQARFCDTLGEALSLSGARFIVGTTGRDRRYWRPSEVPEAARTILARASVVQTALVFGPEDSGLTNDELTLCHQIITLPVAGDLTSYNLSHAAAIILFSLMTADHPDRPGGETVSAGFEDLEGMYGHIQELLTEIRFLWEDNPHHMMRAVREFINRSKPTEQDVRIIRGICRRMLWHLRNR
ncbi:MAG: RNA methyltransferase [bacterium]|nr:MAG: RNA methyltransferase [bacterium]